VVGLKAALAAIGPDNGSIHRLDVRDRHGWDNALGAFTRETGGKLDALLNNAGVARFGSLEELSEADCDIQIDINIKGVIHGARAGLAPLKAGGGRLINVVVRGAVRLAEAGGLFGHQVRGARPVRGAGRRIRRTASASPA
jgi:NADP-dependent 3-hydroxy acid dehydrogenase YdfG